MPNHRIDLKYIETHNLEEITGSSSPFPSFVCKNCGIFVIEVGAVSSSSGTTVYYKYIDDKNAKYYNPLFEYSCDAYIMKTSLE